MAKKSSWIPATDVNFAGEPDYFIPPYVRPASNMLLTLWQMVKANGTTWMPFGPENTSGMAVPYYAISDSIDGRVMAAVDAPVATFFLQIMNPTDSISSALSNIVATLSTTAYYEQFPQSIESGSATLSFS